METVNKMIPYCDTDYTMEACKRIVEDNNLREEYQRVEIREQPSGLNGKGEQKRFGKIFVSRE